MKILLTGDKGLIGRHLRVYLESRDHEVIGMDLKDKKNICDISDDYVKIDFDMIIHCAACSIRECIDKPWVNFVNNINGTQNIMEFARLVKCKKIIYFSSSRVLSRERNPYTAAKIFGEELVKGYKDCYDIDYMIVRPSTVFGEKDDSDRLVPRFINNALKNKSLDIYGAKNKTLYLTYVKDFVEMFKGILEKDVWNTEHDMAIGKEVELKQLAEFIITQVGSKSKIKIKKAETAQPQYVDLKNLYIEPLYGWQAGIINSIEYYRGKK